MMRFSDWQVRLVAYLSQASGKAFQEGLHDCALFGAGAVLTMTGMDYAAPYRGRYSTTRGGLRILKREGFADHIALAAHHLSDKGKARANPGDLAVVAGIGGPALGVVQGEAIYVLQPDRMALVPLIAAQRVFEV